MNKAPRDCLWIRYIFAEKHIFFDPLIALVVAGVRIADFHALLCSSFSLTWLTSPFKDLREYFLAFFAPYSS